MFVEMELAEIQKSELMNQPQVILLTEKGGNRTFPIFIGYYEASALEMSVMGYKTPRPMTHDLIFNILEAYELQLVRVLVDELRSDTFIGKLVIVNNLGEETLVDSRPSDAIVLASKMKVPVFVDEEVLSQVVRGSQKEAEGEEPFQEPPEDSI